MLRANNGVGVLSFVLPLLVLTGCSAQQAPSRTPALIADVEYRQFFGTTVAAQWLAPNHAIFAALDGRRFDRYPTAGSPRQCTISLARQQSEICNRPTLEVKDCADVDEHPIAIAASWDAVPRVVKRLDPAHATYRALLAQWLHDRGIDDASPTMDQLLRVDLEGDGTDEVLMSATRHRGSVRSALAGDYSVVLLRRIVGDSTRTVVLQQDLYPQACAAECEPQTLRIVAVLDVNGDGVLDIVIERKYFEGIERIIYSLEKAGPKARLSWACGV